MANSYGRYTNTYAEQKAIEITEVVTADKLIQGIDHTGVEITVRIGNVASAFRWPAIGESWVVERQRGYWTLVGREQQPYDNVPIQSGEPGDAMLEGTRVLANGLPVARVYKETINLGPTIITHNLDNLSPVVSVTSSPIETKLAEDLDFDDLRITVESTDGFADSGVLYIANERLTYGAKFATYFTEITRGEDYDHWETGGLVHQGTPPAEFTYLVINNDQIEVTTTGYGLNLTVIG